MDLPYGRAPYPIDLDDRPHVVVRAPAAPPFGATLDELLAAARGEPLGGGAREAAPEAWLPAMIEAALDAPIGRPRLEDLVGANDRVTVVVSDPTRAEPRAAFLDALRARMPAVRWTIAVATGTHGPARLDALGLPAWALREARIVNHDGHREDDLVRFGVTPRGTPIRLHRCVLDADLVVATGCIRPHYFAGFGAGVKAIFPGLGDARAIRMNHRLKLEFGARAGNVDGNPCRADLEDAVRALPTPTFLLNGACAADGHIHAVVAGDLFTAFRTGATLVRRWFAARAPRAPLVIASDAPPVTATLYQAAKIAAAVADLVAPRGTLLVVAECAEGIGPLDVVNEAILRIGVLPRLAPGVAVRLVSGLAPEEVARTLVGYAGSVREVVDATPGPIVVVPNASQLILEVG